MNVHERDKACLGRDCPPFKLELAASEGSFLYDANGRRYIDFLMGWCVGNIGWGNTEIRQTMREFVGPEYVNPTYSYKPWVQLAETLAEVTPGKLRKSFRATGGTESVEIAMQAAMAHTGRTGFVSVRDAYHGHSIGAMSVGPDAFRTKYGNLLPNCEKISLPLDKCAGSRVADMLQTKKYAAFISEPIICNLGVYIPDKDFFTIIQDACKHTKTVLIMDEVATGFGRTGKFFASEHFDIEPDIMCLGKAMSGGYGPIGTAIMTDDLAKSMEFDFSVYSTFGWHPLGVLAAKANLDYFLQNRQNLFEHIAKMSEYFKERLSRIPYRYPTMVRISGLAIGVESSEPGYTSGIAKRCEERGLLFHAFDNFKFVLYPALNISLEVAKMGLDIIEECA